MRRQRGVTLVELVAALGLMGLAVGGTVAVVQRLLDALRVHGATSDLYAAVHLARAQARARGVMHALVIEPDGRGFRIREEPTSRTVSGPHTLPEGVYASANVTIRFSPRGFAVPFGTITVTSGSAVRKIIVNILGRVRVA